MSHNNVLGKANPASWLLAFEGDAEHLSGNFKK